ncbi:MAG: hypothetical protein JNM84_08550 [Planctomycetes bacterium]|nr:hypothetical protein [Planctomycetota bacterium]
MPPRSHAFAFVLAALTGSLLATLSSCSDSSASGADSSGHAPAQGAASAAILVDRAIPAAQRELLTLAFEAASAIPEHPHIKSKLRAQDEVLSTCLELDLPLTTSRWLDQVQGWRRGALHADLAHWLAQHGQSEVALEQIQRARAYEESPIGNPSAQEWRRDRVRAKVGRAYLALGRSADAEPLLSGLVESEQSLVAVARVEHLDAQDFSAQLSALDPILNTAGLDQVRAALDACVELHRRFYADAEKRTALEQRVRSSSQKIPFEVRLALYRRLAESAIEAADLSHARSFVAELLAVLDSAKWLPEDELRLRAELSALRYRAGEGVLAAQDLGAVLERYEGERERIVDIYRSRVLRSIAAAYQTQGDASRARTLFLRAAEEGFANPNALPRAEDLLATCCAIVRSGLEPEPEQLERLRTLRRSLRQPW